MGSYALRKQSVLRSKPGFFTLMSFPRRKDLKKMPSLSGNNLMMETNRLDSANSNLAQLQRDLTEAR